MATSVSRKRKLDAEDDELMILLFEQRRELTAAVAADSDLDFSFQLQMEEAIKVSLTSQPSSSLSSSHQPFLLLNEVTDAPSGISRLIAEEIDKFERERSDREFVEAETRNMQENLNLLIHDQIFARQIKDAPEDEWRRNGDNIEKPYGLLPSSNKEAFRVYFKGLVSDETVMNVKMSFAGIGVAICDTSDCCVFELRKPYLLGGNEDEGDLVELQALIEALNTAVTLGLKRVHIFCDSDSVYQYVTGKGQPTDNKFMTLIDQLNIIQRKFAHCSPFLVNQDNVKFAFQFAIDAIVSQTIPIGNLCDPISIKDKNTCKVFLNPELHEIMSSRVKEAPIPPSEKIYCPFSNCSTLMSKTEVHPVGEEGMRKCIKCRRLFCINCNVPWHYNKVCGSYSPPSIEAKLQSLAKRKQWHVDTSFVTRVELSGLRRNPRASVQFGTRPTLYMPTRIDRGNVIDHDGSAKLIFSC
ncbi:hypothetical protein L1887_00842 [Cichorium endivia]|nr:hypothetical protein L1887_00842 [Cichorium endivia]